jgi:peptide/nickel transport system permease protein
MINYIVRRLVYTALLLLASATAIFFIVQLVPGNPYDRMIKEMADRNPQALARIPDSHWDRLNSLLGLDKPLGERYLAWMRGVISGNFGESWSVYGGQAVFAVIRDRLPYTLLLIITATLLSLLLAMPLGIYSALHQYSNGDFFIMSFSLFGMAMPSFWFGILLISLFSSTGVLPSSGVSSWGMEGDMVNVILRVLTLGLTNQEVAGNELKILGDGLQHLIMPAVTVSIFLTARWSRFVRTSFLEIMGHDYIRTARAKGVAEWGVIMKHGLRNGLIPMMTLLALDIPALFTGAFITEIVFAWPGIGKLYVASLKSADWPMLMGLLVASAFFIIFANLLTDLLYMVVDPRVRVDAQGGI